MPSGNQDVGAKSSRERRLLFGGAQTQCPASLEDLVDEGDTYSRARKQPFALSSRDNSP